MSKSAIAGILVLMAQATTAAGQTSGPGTAGAANAAAASPGGVPTMPGTAPGSTSPGGINGVPEAPQSAPPSASPNQVPNTGPLLNPTVPLRASGVIGRSSRVSARRTVGSNAPLRSQRALDRALADSVDQKVKSICKGC
jgi:hypothetical protein